MEKNRTIRLTVVSHNYKILLHSFDFTIVCRRLLCNSVNSIFNPISFKLWKQILRVSSIAMLFSLGTTCLLRVLGFKFPTLIIYTTTYNVKHDIQNPIII